MRIPFLKKRKYLSIKRSTEPAVIKNVRASAFFANASIAQKEIVFSKALKEVNKEQKEVVRKFGKATT